MPDNNFTDNDSPFPSNAEMDLDMMRASPLIGRDHSRAVIGATGKAICEVYGAQHHDPVRDALCRRIERMGDVYEELRLLIDRASAAGVDVRVALEVLNDFVAPKPFSEE
jgi:hypothetical protein